VVYIYTIRCFSRCCCNKNLKSTIAQFSIEAGRLFQAMVEQYFTLFLNKAVLNLGTNSVVLLMDLLELGNSRKSVKTWGRR